jgi:hypothetical protein
MFLNSFRPFVYFHVTDTETFIHPPISKIKLQAIAQSINDLKFSKTNS